jgi:hypothetical protein
MKSEKIKIINPQDGVKWKQVLGLLKEEQPGAVNILMQTESLVDFLDSAVAHIVVYRHQLINAGTTRQDAEKRIIYRLLPAEIHGIAGSINEERLETLLSSLEDREVEIEVF